MRYIFGVLKWLCTFTPLVLCSFEFGAISPQNANTAVFGGYVIKMSFFSLFATALILLSTKRYWLTKYIDESSAIQANLKSVLLVETDVQKKENAKKALSKISFKTHILQAIIPMIFLFMGYFAVYALEKTLVKLNHIYLISIALFVGSVIFGILEDNAKINKGK